jgi:hypothetical protein
MLGRTTPHVGSWGAQFKRKLPSNQSCQQHKRSSMSVDVSGTEGISARRDGFGVMFGAATAWRNTLE